MPTYVYKFVETGETIEVQQAFTDDALTEAAHPASGELMRVKKVFQPVGVTFKGGGFYKNDSRGSSKSAASTDTAATPATPATPAADKGSSTPAATPAAPAAPAPAPAPKTPAPAS